MSSKSSESKDKSGSGEGCSDVTNLSDLQSGSGTSPEHHSSSGQESNRQYTTGNETLIHFLKCNVGSGILALPEAFMNAGLWVGLAGIPIIGAICAYCMFRLAHCAEELCRRKNLPSLTYEDTASAACEFGPAPFRKKPRVFSHIIRVFLCLTQLGFCCVYFVFIAQNMKQAVDGMRSSESGISYLGFMGIFLLPVLLVSFVPNLKYLAPFSLVAGIVQTSGLVIILYYSVRDLPEVYEPVPAFNGWTTLPLYFGSTVFAFEGIGLVLPLKNQMRHPSQLLGYTGVLSTAVLLLICLYSAVGFYGYLYYGNSVSGSITLNLPGDEMLAQTVKITMAIAIFFTYPLQIYVVFEMIKPLIHHFFTTRRNRMIVDYTSRVLIVLFTFTLAALVPNIGLFISLVGAFSNSALSLIFPPIIDSCTFWEEDRIRRVLRFIKNALILIFGLLGFVAGTATSVKGIVIYYKGGDKEVRKFMSGLPMELDLGS